MKKGGFAVQYQALPEWFNPQISQELALPKYCDKKGELITVGPGCSGTDKSQWDDGWRKFYETEVNASLHADPTSLLH